MYFTLYCTVCVFGCVVDVDILPVNHMLHSTCWVVMPGNLMIEEHTLPPLWRCLLVGLIAGVLGIYEQIPAATNQTCKKRKKKRVVKQLTPFGATHTQRHDTSPLAVYRQCVLAVRHTLPVTVSQPAEVYYLNRGTFTSTQLYFLQPNKHCVLFVFVWLTRGLVVDEVIPRRNHCVVFAFVLMWQSEEGQ